ncbi:MAG: GIY-YIG nuclease family protein [Terracidiphilus sp.]|jgi:hypothetical protein
MGYVYAGQGENTNQFKIGRTSDEPRKRRAQHRTSNPQFSYYRTYKTTHPCAAEKFLKKLFAEKRVPNTKEWFNIGCEEIDSGFLALDVYMQTHLSIAQEKEVKSLAKQMSDGVFLTPDDSHRELFHFCRKLKNEIEIRKLEYEHWKDQLKLQIGCHDGIEGLFQWKSQPQHDLDEDKLKSEYPEVWEACQEEISVRKFYLLDGDEE